DHNAAFGQVGGERPLEEVPGIEKEGRVWIFGAKDGEVPAETRNPAFVNRRAIRAQHPMRLDPAVKVIGSNQGNPDRNPGTGYGSYSGCRGGDRRRDQGPGLQRGATQEASSEDEGETLHEDPGRLAAADIPGLLYPRSARR